MKIINNVVMSRATIEYYDIQTVETNLQISLTFMAITAKAVVNNNWVISPPTSFVVSGKKISYIGINRNQITANGNQKNTIGEAIEAAGLSSYFSDDNKISEEQFYDLTAPTE